MDMVEPNQAGIVDINKLFAAKEIEKSRYNLYQTMIEDYVPKRKYDIIIAEGFLPCVSNKAEIVKKIGAMLAEHGIVVTTCMDEMGLFIEQLKRLVGNILVKDLPKYEDKVNRLVEVFEPQLKLLRGVSRSVEDWVQDQLLCPTINLPELLSLKDAIELFGEDYEVLGSSPNMFTDYSWYKDVQYPYKESYKEQFAKKRHNLLVAGTEESMCEANDNEVLNSSVIEIRKHCILYEETAGEKSVERVANLLEELRRECCFLDDGFKEYLLETETILSKIISKRKIDFTDYPAFMKMFGRSQQYISLYKKVHSERNK